MKIFLCLFMLSSVAIASPKGWDSYINSLKIKMKKKNISSSLINKAFSEIKFLSRSVKSDSSQAEFVKTFENYYKIRVKDSRIEAGKKAWKKHKNILNKTSKKFGIPPHYLLAFWGLETNYGNTKGKKHLLSTLSTLAFDGRRRTFFEKQILATLKAIDSEKLPMQGLVGSWAGAFGNFQFIPTTYEKYAIDGDGDGKIDLMNSIPDSLFSAGNYLSQIGWIKDQKWGREVVVSKSFDWSKYKEGEKRFLKDWNKLGVRQTSGKDLPKAEIKAKLIAPQGSKGVLFLAYSNFDKIMKWNRSTFYAITVGRLADRIIGRAKLYKLLKETNLTKSEVKNAQKILKKQGLYISSIDGIIGKGMRKAVRLFQLEKGLTSDGNLDKKTYDLLTR